MDIRKFVASLDAQEKDELLLALSQNKQARTSVQQTFQLVRVGACSGEQEQELNEYIAAIKLVREWFGVGLREARDMVDSGKLTVSSIGFLNYQKLFLEHGWYLKFCEGSEPF